MSINKIKLIKADIDRLQETTMDENRNFLSSYHEGIFDGLSMIDNFIDSLEEEPISEDLEEAARRIATRHSHITGDTYYANDAWFFKKGAQWQKEQDQSTIELAEDHAYLEGQEKIIDKACEWLTKHWREYVWLTDNDVIHFGHWEHDFKKAMEE